MKRIICFILTFTIACSLFVVGVGAKSSNHSYTEAIEVLSRLKIIDISDPDTFDPNAMVTRAQFAEYLSLALGLNVDSKRVYFADVGVYDSFSKYVTALVESGIINGRGDGYFNPYDAIKPEEAYKMIVIGMGYKDWAESMGGFPNGYAEVANQIDIIPSSISREMTNSQVAVLLHNACMAERLVPVSLDGRQPVFGTDSKQSIYKTIHGLEYVQGIINGAGGIDLNDEERKIEDYYFVLGDNEYYLGQDTYEYLGCYANVFYYQDFINDTNNVFYISLPEKKNNTVTVTSEMFDTFQDNLIKYYPNKDSARTTNLKIASNAVFCLNRSIFSKSVSTVFDDFKYGKIVLKDIDSDDIFDVIMVTSYENIVVGMVDYDKNIIYNKAKIGDSISLDDYDKVIIRDLSGSTLSKENMSVESVLTIAKSTDNKCIEILVSYTNISGNITKAEEIDDELVVTINGKEYFCDNDYKEYIKGFVGFGMSYTFYSDVFGRIVYVGDVKTEGMILGYLLKVYYDSNEMETPMLKIYNENAQMVKIACNEKVKVDGINKKDPEKILTAIPDTYKSDVGYIIVPQLIRYKLNQDGLINEIDTLKFNSSNENKKNSLELVDSGGMYFDHVQRLGMKGIIGSSTKVFKIPYDSQNHDEGSYSIDNSFRAWTSYDASIYTVDKDKEFADAIIIKTTSVSNIQASDHVAMLAEIEEYLNEDDEVKTKITYYVRGSKYEKNLDTKAYKNNSVLNSMTAGDLLVFGTNSNDEINDALLFYDYSKYEGNKPIEWSGYYTDTGKCWYKTSQSSTNLIFGYVNQVVGNTIRIGYYKDEGYDEAHSATGNVTIYDSTKKKDNVYTIPISQIHSYMSVGGKCDTMIIQTKDYRNYNGVYIYR